MYQLDEFPVFDRGCLPRVVRVFQEEVVVDLVVLWANFCTIARDVHGFSGARQASVARDSPTDVQLLGPRLIWGPVPEGADLYEFGAVSTDKQVHVA